MAMSDTDSDNENYYDQSDPKNAVCDTCRYIRIPQFFVSIHRESAHDTLAEILSKQASCALCRLVGHAIHVSACAACDRPPPLPEDLVRFNPHEMFPKMKSGFTYIRSRDSRWVAQARHLRDRDGTDVAYALKRRVLDGRPAAMRIRVIVELGVLEALEGEIHLLAADAARLKLAPSFHNVVVAERVDIAWIRGVLSACTRHPKCQSSKQSRFPVAVRVVDTLERAVVPLDARSGYVALSYTWGGDQQFKLLLENIAQWSQPGGMPPLDQLPPTIRDSMILCRQLHRRYLWIDSLCITQNDASTLRGQLEQMDLIYRCAEFTIVAAAGLGANAGLPGIASTPRAPQQLVETVHGLRLAVPLPSLAEAAKHSFWKTRAWTYQEQMLSSKVLAFTSRQVYYECASEIYTEDNLPDAEDNDDEVVLRTDVDARDGLERMAVPDASAGTFAAEQDTPFNSFLMYQTAVANYTARNLGNPSDILNAFIGVANAFQRYSGMRGFIGGLSVMGLSDALLWRPEPATRLVRQAVVNPATGRLFPAWSWAGYVGPVAVERTSDAHALGRVVSEWAAVYSPLEGSGERVCLLPSIEIDDFRDADFFSASPSPWELLHAPALRLRTEVCCSLGVVARSAEWASLCSWDCVEGSVPHAICIWNAEGVCVGSASLDNSATPQVENDNVLVAVSKGWHPKTDYSREFSTRQAGGIATVNILLGKKLAAGVERIGIGTVVETEWFRVAMVEEAVLLV